MLSARANVSGRGDACGALGEACGARDDNSGFCVEPGGGSLYRVLQWSEDRCASLKLSDALLAIAARPHSGVNPSLGGSTCVSFRVSLDAITFIFATSSAVSCEETFFEENALEDSMASDASDPAQKVWGPACLCPAGAAAPPASSFSAGK